MVASDDLKRFEACLTPIVRTAYGMARYLTNDREQAEVLLQSVVVRAFAAFQDYQPGRNFLAWFLRFLCAEFLSQPVTAGEDIAAWESAADLLLIATRSLTDPNYEVEIDLLFTHLDTDKISDAFARMPKPYRVVCALYFLADWSYEEIADLAGCAPEVARLRLHRGRRWLLAALAERPSVVLTTHSDADARLRSSQFAM